ncbi:MULTISPECIES: PTS glucose transporter subunit IIABC [unclassified Lactobacillus]|uniref:glucose PTS transporter subunit IIA n=1 Tax=unclassified Lactobacillus TaxID=2620435 RepID=UPI000EFB45A5|nr:MULTISPECIES: PTS glucose transporter subunit IIABC [unclassified Lactobacillus]RMC26319.1 PTS beta-glucoside transporter subunit IIABC [Lactobacillus sp. ESL0247]RMC29857.1 PTS beta-glucoside transporter subunit IIABC [Lactobacillus sp. ESL0246]RMC34514.1 PTS beta-glucoside transporter subunit IIABC [Lactobacillus sp. ESL0245]
MDNKIKLVAPTTGRVINLSEVNDPVFSQKTLGEGFGLAPSSGEIISPISGQVVMIAETKHAIGLKIQEGVEILIHLGIDTVELKGKPFTLNIKAGDNVHVGERIGTMDLEAINAAHKQDTIIVAITNTAQVLDKIDLNLGMIKAGEVAATISLKQSSKEAVIQTKESQYQTTAREILTAVGGMENVKSVIHCFTRLRFTLKDDGIPDDKQVNAIKGVIDVARANNQYQVVIGQTVDDVYDALIKLLGPNYSQQTQESVKKSPVPKTVGGKIKNGFFQLISVITGSMMPVIGLLAASGMLKGVLNILTNFYHMSTTSSTYTIINAMGDAAFYFLPIIVGFTAAQKLGSNPVIVSLIGGFLIYPDLVKIFASGKFTYYLAGVGINANFFGIPIHIPQYTYSIFPMIFAAWMAAKIEPWIKKWMPITLRQIFTPLVEIFLVGMTVLIIVGPVISFISEGIATILQWLLTVNSALSGLIIGGFYQVLVIFGLHWAVIPLIANDIAANGHSVLNGIVSVTMIAQGAGALAVWVKTKHNPDLKGLSLSAAISAAVGITEPAMYGVNLKYGQVFLTSSIGAAIGGLVNGLLKVDMYGFTGSLIGFPSFVAKAGQGNPNNLMNFWIVSIITIIASFTLTYFFGYHENDADNPKNAPQKKTLDNL